MDNSTDTISAKTTNDILESEPVIEPLDGAETPSPARPCVLVLHASVGSGHRSAAIAIGQAFEELRDSGACIGTSQTPVPADLDVEVIDILDFGRIVFDGDKTASMFTGFTRPIYDLTWRFT
ncbi:MAG: hypothetical protein RSA14_00255, partial [Raoultibacter sp.]